MKKLILLIALAMTTSFAGNNISSLKKEADALLKEGNKLLKETNTSISQKIKTISSSIDEKLSKAQKNFKKVDLILDNIRNVDNIYSYGYFAFNEKIIFKQVKDFKRNLYSFTHKSLSSEVKSLAAFVQLKRSLEQFINGYIAYFYYNEVLVLKESNLTDSIDLKVSQLKVETNEIYWKKFIDKFEQFTGKKSPQNCLTLNGEIDSCENSIFEEYPKLFSQKEKKVRSDYRSDEKEYERILKELEEKSLVKFEIKNLEKELEKISNRNFQARFPDKE